MNIGRIAAAGGRKNSGLHVGAVLHDASSHFADAGPAGFRTPRTDPHDTDTPVR